MSVLKVNLDKPRQTVITHTVRETRELGRKLSKILHKGNIVTFQGELGSGKTCIVQGICQGLGYDGRVTSPSFALVHEYPGPLSIYHMDLYRINGIHGIEQLEWEEYIYGDGVCLIEWAEKINPLLPDKKITVSLIAHENKPTWREITIVKRK